MMNTPYLLTGAAFVVVTAVFFALLFRHIDRAIVQSGWSPDKQKKVRRGTLVAFFGWAALLAVGSLSGFTSNFVLFPANAAPVILIPLITILLVVFSGKMAHLLQFIPEKALVNLQVFRVFVEVLLWALFIQGLVPEQMTFEGRNFDVLSGLTAPLVAWGLVGKKKWMVVWHVLCLGLLINIVGTALLSMPTPFRIFPQEPANTIVLDFPFILLPGFLVPLAYGLHFLALRQLSLRK